VTHDVNEAVALADWIFVLSARPARLLGSVHNVTPRGRMAEFEERSMVAQIKALQLG
jgi:ABC-type nitrate/sulfonate/bicarbonate transport system ATPase subunit